MPCLTPYRGDTSQMLLFKIASCLEASGAAGAAVLSFNGRTGDVVLTLADVAAVADDIYVNESGDTMTGNLVHPDGTAALPSITFTGDLDTGIYHPAANTTGLSAGGSLIFAVSPTGVNLTTALAYQYNSVNVIRAQTALGNYFFGPSGNLTMTGGNNTSLGDFSFLSNTSGSANTAIGVASLANNTTGSNNASFGTNSLVANISGNQNLGIGTSSLLDLLSGSNNTGIGFGTGLGITTGSNNTIIGANVAGLAAGLSNNIILADGAGNQRINVDSSGNVGIGTPTPGATLDVVGDGVSPNIRAFGSGFPMVSTRSSNGSVITKIQSIGPDFGYVGTESSHPLHVIVGNSVKMAILTSGNVGIGTVAPGFGLTLGVAVALAMDSGVNQRAGDAVLVGGTVTVANTTVTANTRVFLTRRVTGGTIGFAVTYTVLAATSFTITSDNVLDTSTYSYLLIEVP